MTTGKHALYWVHCCEQGWEMERSQVTSVAYFQSTLDAGKDDAPGAPLQGLCEPGGPARRCSATLPQLLHQAHPP